MAARLIAGILLLLFVSGCGATAMQVIPTDPPTITPTSTATASRTPGGAVTPTPTPTAAPASPTGGPSPTPLFGPTRTLAAVLPTPTRVVNPNAPRIEFFTSDTLAVAPGGSVTLFWSTRGANGAVIYRLDQNNVRNQLWNVAPDGNLTVPTRRA
ncbi:MAG: hypothetical protein K8I30_25060, partial [Anaerolineae bacterium]|nr:hypothetical protein [Anaerolineae bacterium]